MTIKSMETRWGSLLAMYCNYALQTVIEDINPTSLLPFWLHLTATTTSCNTSMQIFLNPRAPLLWDNVVGAGLR